MSFLPPYCEHKTLKSKLEGRISCIDSVTNKDIYPNGLVIAGSWDTNIELNIPL